MEYLEENYKEDGFIYCIKTGLKDKNGREIVKCGRVEMKREELEMEVVEKIIRRYSTYYTECEILYWKRVGNNKKAEKELFKKIRELKYEKEKFILEEKKIEESFEEIGRVYPNIEEVIEKISIEKQTELNNIIRNIEKEK